MATHWDKLTLKEADEFIRLQRKVTKWVDFCTPIHARGDKPPKNHELKPSDDEFKRWDALWMKLFSPAPVPWWKKAWWRIRDAFTPH